MHFYGFASWQQTSRSPVLLLDTDRTENTVSLLLLPVFVFTNLLPGNTPIKSVTILRRIPKKLGVRVGLNSSGSGQHPRVGSCKHGSEHLGSIKGIKLDLLASQGAGVVMYDKTIKYFPQDSWLLASK
jgi:hypothetical protein